MLLKVADFRELVFSDIDRLISDLQDETGRQTEDESFAWRESLPKLSKALSSPSLQEMHFYFGGKGNMMLEYRLPASASWCDIVLLGKHRGTSSAVLFELKNWQTRTDSPGDVEGLVNRQGTSMLHPSDQVRGYAEYCRRFHSAVKEYRAEIHGCVLFTKDQFYRSYELPPNNNLVSYYPCSTTESPSSLKNLEQYLSDRISEVDHNFATSFDTGLYQQDRGFIKQVAKHISSRNIDEFELLDNQRLGFSVAKNTIENALFHSDGTPKELKRKVFIIEGPPGSGKSVIAARLWTALVQNPLIGEGNIVITSTSSSQHDNWEHLISKASQTKGASGIIKKANIYSPCTTHELGKLRKIYPDMFENIDDWRNNLIKLKNIKGDFRLPDGTFLVSIVDEAHALINPEHNDSRGQYGFPVHFGPQAYHIIRGSIITIFLLDSQQNFRERESTSKDDLVKWANELGADIVPTVTLDGVQFRCAGSVEYIDWIESVLKGIQSLDCKHIANNWKGSNSIKSRMEFRIFDSPEDLECALRVKLKETKRIRILSSYAREWKTKTVKNPHQLPDEYKDFHEEYVKDGVKKFWSRIWNFKHNVFGYTAFVQSPKGTLMNDDPLCEVGCPYVVRGFDWDYIGLLWLDDVYWNGENWAVNLEKVFESGLARHIGRAKKEPINGEEHKRLLMKLIQGYRILLSRAIKGVYIWFQNEKTRERFEDCL